jgi:hypothetical protein
MSADPKSRIFGTLAPMAEIAGLPVPKSEARRAETCRYGLTATDFLRNRRFSIPEFP